MGKSKSGGTRAYLRGRVGADVYSIGKDGKGKKQQVVRSLAENVTNPRTINQMRTRMIMSTVSAAMAGLKAIVDHSFDGVVGAQPNLSEFTARNFALVKADAVANPSSGNAFGLVKFGEKGIKQGAYVIADGSAILPTAVTLDAATGKISIALGSNAATIAGLKSALGLTSDEFLTLVGISASKGAVYARVRINPAKADADVINASTVAGCFATEGNAAPAFAFSSNTITITLADAAGNAGVIVSRKVEGGYIHNNCVLSTPSAPVYTSDIALPTYPVGEQDFLNGGDIFGMSEA